MFGHFGFLIASFILDTYNITNERGKVCTLTLQKKAFKLGEDIVGTFDFSQAASVCSQVGERSSEFFFICPNNEP